MYLPLPRPTSFLDGWSLGRVSPRDGGGPGGATAGFDFESWDCVFAAASSGDLDPEPVPPGC